MQTSKNILIFADGTGQYGGLRPDQRLSNIYKMYRAMRPGFASEIDPAKQIAFYDPGLGSGDGGGRIKNILSAAFGTGISQNIADCYEAILKHYKPGDRIYLFGFSRGAYTVRCVANVLNLCGVPTQDIDGKPLPPGGKKLRKIAERAVYQVYEHGSGHPRETFEAEREEQARRFRADFKCTGCGLDGEEQGNVAPHFIGVFDTVAALGGVIVRRILLAVTILALALAVASCAWSWPVLGKIASFVPAALLVLALIWATSKQLKVIRDGPVKKGASRHFAKWRLKNYDRFLDTNVGLARHALSIDENRARFPQVGWGYSADVQRMEQVRPKGPKWLDQVWFAGNHSDIGGSYPEEESRLSDIALGWMLDELRSIEFPPTINDNLLHLFPDATGLQHDEVKSSLEGWLSKIFAWKETSRTINPEAALHPSVISRFEQSSVAQYDVHAPYRPENLHRHVKVQHFYK